MHPDTVPCPLVFYDARCGFCSRIVRRLLAVDRGGILRFAPLDGSTAATLRRLRPDFPETADSLLLLERGDDGRLRVLARSAAALRVAVLVGGVWRILGRLGRLLPRRLADTLYDGVARRRHRLSPAPRAICPLPSPEAAARFLP